MSFERLKKGNRKGTGKGQGSRKTERERESVCGRVRESEAGRKAQSEKSERKGAAIEKGVASLRGDRAGGQPCL